jgi:hypothetical protein
MKPTFGFPQSMQPFFPAIHNGGTFAPHHELRSRIAVAGR